METAYPAAADQRRRRVPYQPGAAPQDLLRSKPAVKFRLLQELGGQSIDLLQKGLTFSDKVGNLLPAIPGKHAVFHSADVFQNVVLGAL